MTEQMEFNFGVKIDPSVKKAVTELERLRAAEKKLASEIVRGGKSSDKGAKALSKLRREATQLEKALDIAGRGWRDMAEDIDEATAAARKLEQQIDSADERFSSTSRGVAQFGDAESAARTIGGAFGAAGVEDIERAVSALSEIPASLEALPKLKSSLQALPAAAAKASEILGLSGLAGSLQVVAPGLSATAAGAVALALPLVVVVAALAALSIGMNAYNERLEDVKAAQDRLNDVLLQGVSTSNEIKELQQQGDNEALVNARNSAFAVRAELAQQYELLNQDLAEQRRELERAGPALPGNLARDAIVTIMGSLETSIKELEGPIGQASDRLSQFDTAIANLSQSELDAIKYTEELAKAEQDLVKAEQDRATTLAKLIALEKQATLALENFSRRRLQQAEDAALERKFDFEDNIAELQSHVAKLADIRQQGNKALEKIDAELASLPTERNKALAEATLKSNASLGKINQNYFNKQISALDKFRLTEQRVNERYQKTLRRTLEDLRDSLSDAEASNDVNAFLSAQRDGQKQLKRLSEDQSDDARQRIQDFTKQRVAEQQAHVEKLAEINRTLQAEKSAISEAFGVRRTELADSLELEKIARQERLRSERDRYIEAERREAQQADRAAQRLEIRTRREDEALQRQLDAINKKTQAELLAVSQVTAAMVSLATRVAQAASSGRSTPSRRVPRSISPFRSSRGLPLGAGAGGFGSRTGSVINFSPQIMVGDIATGTQVTTALRENTIQLTQMLSGAVRQAVY